MTTYVQLGDVDKRMAEAGLSQTGQNTIKVVVSGATGPTCVHPAICIQLGHGSVAFLSPRETNELIRAILVERNLAVERHNGQSA